MATKSKDVTVAALIGALRKVLPAIDRYPSVPLLEHARLVCLADEMSISGTNLDVEVQATLPAPGRLRGTFFVPPRALLALAKGYSRDDVLTISAVNKVALKIIAGDDEWVLPTLQADEADWPTLAPTEVPACLQLDAGFGGDVLQRALAAVSKEETRYYLNGVNLSAEGDVLKATATNGHRLVTISRTIAGAAGILGEASPIIPHKAVRIIAAAAGPAQLAFSEKPLRAYFYGSDVTVYTKLIDGKFPDWRRVVPAPAQCGYEVDRVSLMRAVARLDALNKVAAGDGDGIVFVQRGGRLFLEARREEGASTTIALAGAPLSSWPEKPVGFSRRYLASLASLARGAALRLEIFNELDACRMTDSAGEDFLGVLMPYRVSGRYAFNHQAPPKPAEAA